MYGAEVRDGRAGKRKAAVKTAGLWYIHSGIRKKGKKEGGENVPCVYIVKFAKISVL